MTAIVIIAAITGLVWGAVFVLRGSLLAGCALFLAAASCFSVEFYSFDAAGLTWSLDRFFLIGLVIAFVVQWRLGRTEPKPLTRREILLVVFVGIITVSAFTHDWRVSVPGQIPIVMHLVNGYLIPLTIYWIARNAVINQQQTFWAYAVLAAFGVYLSVTALLEIGGQWSLVFPRYISDPNIGIHFGRARGPMLQSARLGLYLVAALSAIWIGWWSCARAGRVGRLLAIAITPLFLAAIAVTYTRSVWMGAALAGAIFLVFSLQGRWRFAAIGAMAASAVLVLAVKGNDLIAFKREYTAEETRESTYMRASFAYVSWQMFQEKPLLGFGFGQFSRQNQPYLSDRSTSLRLESIRGYIHHNTFLSLLVETGLVGLIVFLTILAYWLYDGWTLWRCTSAPMWVRAHGLLLLMVFAPYACQLVFREVSFAPLENSLMFLLAGLASGMRASPDLVPSAGATNRRLTDSRWPASASPA